MSAASSSADSSPNGVAYVARANAGAIANYPHMRRVNGYLHVSGTSSRRPDNTHEGAEQQADGSWKLDIRAQTRAVLQNIQKILRLAGADLENLVECTCYLVDMADYKAFNEVYNEFFPDPEAGPCRTTIGVRELPHPNLLIEIKALAKAPEVCGEPKAAADQQ